MPRDVIPGTDINVDDYVEDLSTGRDPMPVDRDVDLDEIAAGVSNETAEAPQDRSPRRLRGQSGGALPFGRSSPRDR
jgi:hypothetical protein